MINYIDLFAGAGGLSEGFTSTGFHPVAHVEMNKDACLTLQTRECYYYLKRNGKLDIYRSYLNGEISRDELYQAVPNRVLNTVINETMSMKGLPALFKKIDSLFCEQKIGKIDLIVGGPPCQAYSLVGRAVKSDGMVNDPRNYLYKIYAEVLAYYKPQMFVFENVPGLLTANKGKYFDDMRALFKAKGYELNYKVLNAADYGVLQNRRRVILIGWKKGSGLSYPEFQQVEHNYIVNDILSDLPIMQAGEEKKHYKPGGYSDYLRKFGIREPNEILTWQISRPNIERDKEIYRQVISAWNNGEQKRLKYTDLPDDLCTHRNKTSFLDRFKIVEGDTPACHTMMAHISKDGHYFIHPDINQSRSITVREAARIQSFPDNYFFEGSRTAAYTQVGNAVPPLMAKGIANGIKKMMEKG